MKGAESFRASITRNPLAWILFALLLVAEYGNYMRGHDLSRVCELLGPFDASFGHPQTAREEIATICLTRQEDAYE